jgi:hypothetical protein
VDQTPVNLLVLGLSLLVGAAFYVFVAYCMVVLARKTGHTLIAWWGWVPVLNAFLMVKVAGKPNKWFYAMFLPLVLLPLMIIPILGGLLILAAGVFVLVLNVLVWMAIARVRNKPAWLGAVAALVPVAMLAILPYLAFSDENVA